MRAFIVKFLKALKKNNNKNKKTIFSNSFTKTYYNNGAILKNFGK